VLSRFLRRKLTAQPTAIADETGWRQRSAVSPERPRERVEPSRRAPLGRALVILAWCLFGTAALGAAVVGVAPQFASSLFRTAALPGVQPSATDPTAGAVPATSTPPAPNLGNSAGGAAGTGAQAPVNPSKPAPPQARKKRAAGTTGSNPTYWGLPEAPSR
jgi:hypothetical protein